MAVKQDGLYFVLFPKQGIKLESVVLKRVCILRNFCPEQGQRFKTSAAHLHPSIGRVSPPPPGFRTIQVIILHGGE